MYNILCEKTEDLNKMVECLNLAKYLSDSFLRFAWSDEIKTMVNDL